MIAKLPSPSYLPTACSLVLAFLIGCSSSTAPPLPAGGTADSKDTSKEAAAKAPMGPLAKELLEKMHSAYQGAKSYTDNVSVVFHAVLRSTGGIEDAPFTRFSVAFERPNKLHVTYQKYIGSPQEETFEVVSDGTLVRSTAAEVPLQIHEAIAPLELSAENFIPDPDLRRTLLENSLENTLPQLSLLLAQEKGQAVFPGEDQAQTLRDAELDGKFFHRIELSSPAGKRVLWIDPEHFTLRRMEMPIDNQRQQMNARNQFLEVGVWLDFETVTLDPEIELATFQLAVPEGARRVRRFISPPPPGPAEVFGKPVGNFALSSLEGEAITPKTLAGKVTILDFWATNCPPCKAQMPVINKIYEHFKDSDDVAFYAVSTDSRALPNEVVEKTQASWGGTMPIARDPESSGYKVLGVRQTPTLILLDRKNQLQVFETGSHQRPDPVIEAIQKLVDGEDLVAEEHKKHAKYLVKYERALEAATIKDSIVEIEMARPEIAPRELPKKMRLKQLWQTSIEQIGRPGDVHVVANEKPEAFRLLVLDGGEAIVEFDNTGTMAGRHRLPKHDKHAGGFLRSWGNDQGERWTLASGVGWQQVYVFDQNWKQVLAFPDEKHSGIGDVLFTDLTGSGTPVMHVGYWGGLGMQGGTLDGRRLWSNRRLSHIVQLGVGPTISLPKQAATKTNASGAASSTALGTRQTAWCSSTRGTLLQISPDGKSIREHYIDGKSLMYFASHPEGKSHCGLAINKVGQYTAVGFDVTGAVAWEYPLPAGEYVEPLPRIQSVAMPSYEGAKSKRAWLIVAANGSLHWLSEAGKLIDRFDYGEILTGVAMRPVGEQKLLFVSTAQNVTAWQVSAPVKPPVKKAKPPEKKKPPAKKAKAKKPKAKPPAKKKPESSKSK